jgi:hypothetical protein
MAPDPFQDVSRSMPLLIKSPVKITYSTILYALNLPWVILYFISVAIMFAAAVFALVMHSRCNAPPILGFISSLLRDSTFFEDVQTGGKGNAHDNSFEDGPTKTKRLIAPKVRVADVRGEDDVGKIAFAPVKEGFRVRKGRLYM